MKNDPINKKQSIKIKEERYSRVPRYSKENGDMQAAKRD